MKHIYSETQPNLNQKSSRQTTTENNGSKTNTSDYHLRRTDVPRTKKNRRMRKCPNLLYLKENCSRMEVYLATIDDYRKITELPDKQKQEFYCRNYNYGKLLNVVIKDFPRFNPVSERLRL